MTNGGLYGPATARIPAIPTPNEASALDAA